MPDLIALVGQPFIVRALLAAALTGVLGGLLGSHAVLRQLAFFGDALGHSALLGVTVGMLLGLQPTLVVIPFAVLFALLVQTLLQHSRLPADALLSLVYSSSLAAAVVLLSLLPAARPRLTALLFGDILGVSWPDLGLLALLLLLTLVLLLPRSRAQILLSFDPLLARSRGVAEGMERLVFLVLLAVVVAVGIRTVGVLLISGFVVIPACTARLLCRRFSRYQLLAALLGGVGAVLGVLASALFNLPAGPAVVVVQMLVFLLTLALANRIRPGRGVPAASGGSDGPGD